jgi:hypothetical protein
LAVGRTLGLSLSLGATLLDLTGAVVRRGAGAAWRDRRRSRSLRRRRVLFVSRNSLARLLGISLFFARLILCARGARTGALVNCKGSGGPSEARRRAGGK